MENVTASIINHIALGLYRIVMHPNLSQQNFLKQQRRQITEKLISFLFERLVIFDSENDQLWVIFRYLRWTE